MAFLYNDEFMQKHYQHIYQKNVDVLEIGGSGDPYFSESGLYIYPPEDFHITAARVIDRIPDSARYRCFLNEYFETEQKEMF